MSRWSYGTVGKTHIAHPPKNTKYPPKRIIVTPDTFFKMFVDVLSPFDSSKDFANATDMSATRIINS